MAKSNNGSIYGPWSPIVLNRLERAVSNAYAARSEMVRRLFDRRRDLDDECGYPKPSELDSRRLYDLYNSEPVAGRVVEVWPKESWAVSPEVYEREDGELSPWEQAVEQLGTYLCGKHSWNNAGNTSSPIWSLLQEADVKSGIGCYGVIYLQFNDASYRSSDQPVVTLDEKGSCETRPYSLTVNQESPVKGLRLEGAHVLPEVSAQVIGVESNPTSWRFGHPTMYQITLNDPFERRVNALTVPSTTLRVHWTRVLHVADNYHHGSGNSIYAASRLEPVIRPVLDIHKVGGSSAEMFYKAAFQGLSFETHPQLGGDVDVDMAALKEMYEEYANGLQRALFTSGLSVKPLSPGIADPGPVIKSAIDRICIKLSIPVPVFMGYEIGEQASKENRMQWDDRVRARQESYLSPRLIAPFFDRLILVKVLPVPEKGYNIYWPDLTNQTAMEKASVLASRTSALASYVGAGLDALIPPSAFFVKELGYSQAEADAILEESAKQAEGESTEESGGSPLLGMVGGITGMIELFKLAKEGGLTEEQLKQQIVLFFKVSEERAAELIAEGLGSSPAKKEPSSE